MAAELALLCLRELEPRLADDPESLRQRRGGCFPSPPSDMKIRSSGSTGAQVLEKKYEKSELVEHLLRAPAPIEESEWQSKADRLIALACDVGLRHSMILDQQGWASIWSGVTGRTIRFVRAP